MRPTSSLLGASRLPLTTKRGNKDYYKGTRQAYVPGSGSHRTGPPGKHVIRGKAKYRLVDEQVRYFVGPGIERIEKSSLKPYVTTKPINLSPAVLPPFAPAPPGGSRAPADLRAFTKAYNSLSTAERQALVQDARRKWWAALVENFPAPDTTAVATEESKTREVEERAAAPAAAAAPAQQ